MLTSIDVKFILGSAPLGLFSPRKYSPNRGVTNGLCEHSRACKHCDFFVSTSRDKKFALRAASSLDSTNRKQRGLLIFSACNNPYGNPFFFFFKKKQKIFYNGGRTSAEGPHGVPS